MFDDMAEALTTAALILLLLVIFGGTGYLLWHGHVKEQWVAQCVLQHVEMVGAKDYCTSLWLTGNTGGR